MGYSAGSWPRVKFEPDTQPRCITKDQLPIEFVNDDSDGEIPDIEPEPEGEA